MNYIKYLFLLISISLSAQSTISYKGETINSLDENGNKTGIWKVYGEPDNVLITIDYGSGDKVSYHKDSKLVAVYSEKDQLEIYKDSKTIKAKYFYRPNHSQTLVDENGNELDPETLKYYYDAAQAYPMFYGGKNALNAFIAANFKANGEKGTIEVKFTVDKNGYTKNMEVVKSDNPKLDEEAKRVVGSLPRWQPGFQRGMFVNVSQNIPIAIK